MDMTAYGAYYEAETSVPKVHYFATRRTKEGCRREENLSGCDDSLQHTISHRYCAWPTQARAWPNECIVRGAG